MKKGIVCTTSYPDNPPEWYWTSGLHDAAILSVEESKFPFDYREFAKKQRKLQKELSYVKN